MNLIISLVLIALTITAIRKYLKERKAERETELQEQRDAFRLMVRNLYRH